MKRSFTKLKLHINIRFKLCHVTHYRITFVINFIWYLILFVSFSNTQLHSVFCPHFLYYVSSSPRQVGLLATVQLHSSQSGDWRKLFAQMVPAADPCHHVWARHMAGIASFTFIDVACCCWMEIIKHTTFTNIFVFPSRWNGVSGKCSWLTSWEDSRLRSPFLFLLSKCMLNTSHTHFGLNNKRTSPSSSSEFFELTNNLEVCKLKWKKCPENVCFLF